MLTYIFGFLGLVSVNYFVTRAVVQSSIQTVIHPADNLLYGVSACEGFYFETECIPCLAGQVVTYDSETMKLTCAYRQEVLTRSMNLSQTAYFVYAGNNLRAAFDANGVSYFDIVNGQVRALFSPEEIIIGDGNLSTTITTTSLDFDNNEANTTTASYGETMSIGTLVDPDTLVYEFYYDYMTWDTGMANLVESVCYATNVAYTQTYDPCYYPDDGWGYYFNNLDQGTFNTNVAYNYSFVRAENAVGACGYLGGVQASHGWCLAMQHQSGSSTSAMYMKTNFARNITATNELAAIRPSSITICNDWNGNEDIWMCVHVSTSPLDRNSNAKLLYESADNRCIHLISSVKCKSDTDTGLPTMNGGGIDYAAWGSGPSGAFPTLYPTSSNISTADWTTTNYGYVLDVTDSTQLYYEVDIVFMHMVNIADTYPYIVFVGATSPVELKYATLNPTTGSGIQATTSSFRFHTTNQNYNFAVASNTLITSLTTVQSTQTSDKRIKNAHLATELNATEMYDAISKIKLYNYTMYDGYLKSMSNNAEFIGLPRFGVFAQDVSPVFPTLVTAEAGVFKCIVDGIETSCDDLLHLDKIGLLFPLMSAFKEAQTKIASLEAEIAAIKAFVGM